MRRAAGTGDPLDAARRDATVAQVSTGAGPVLPVSADEAGRRAPLHRDAERATTQPNDWSKSTRAYGLFWRGGTVAQQTIRT